MTRALLHKPYENSIKVITIEIVTTGGKNESYCNAIDEDSTVKKKRRKEFPMAVAPPRRSSLHAGAAHNCGERVPEWLSVWLRQWLASGHASHQLHSRWFQ